MENEQCSHGECWKRASLVQELRCMLRENGFPVTNSEEDSDIIHDIGRLILLAKHSIPEE